MLRRSSISLKFSFAANPAKQAARKRFLKRFSEQPRLDFSRQAREVAYDAAKRAAGHMSHQIRDTVALKAAQIDPRVLKADDHRNKFYAQQYVGDLQSLGRARNAGVTPEMVAAMGNSLARNVAPPETYTPLLARRMAEGRTWPSASPQTLSALPRTKELPQLPNYENLSPSEQEFSMQLEYMVRRNLRSAPAHITENMDMSEFILDRIAFNRRSRSIAFVWTTTSPEMRYKLEPYVTQLTPWIRRLVDRLPRKFRYVKPAVNFVYKGEVAHEALPKALVQKLEKVHSEMETTMEERVDRLRAMDTVEARLAAVPWFMPYLWVKDKKVREARQSYADMQTLQDRKNGGPRKPDNPGMPNSYTV